MTEEAVEYQAPQSLALMPAMTIGQAVERYQAMAQFVKQLLIEDTDFGRIPGTDKPTLLKPGAEKLTSFFGLTAQFELLDKVEDWVGYDHANEPFFYFRYSCALYSGERHVGEGVGSCNSWEKKYRYRTAQRKCPDCGEATVLKSKFDDSWFCWEKRGGCGAKWPSGTPAIEDQKLGQILNENPADLVNTIDKMAQKRALVAATLITVNASAFFTQDLEDMVTEGQFKAAPENGDDKPEPEAEKPAQKPKRKPRQKPKVEPEAATEPRPFPTYLADILPDADLDAMTLPDFWKMVVKDLEFDHRKHAFAAISQDLGRDDWQTLSRAQIIEVARRHQEDGE